MGEGRLGAADSPPSIVGLIADRTIEPPDEVSEPCVASNPLQRSVERPGVRVLQAPAGVEVRVVDDDVGVRDAVLVVVVVDDRDLVVGEVLPHP